ncbi:MAG: O-antigen ligase family protein [Planctomycetaceae bacterium]|nr:O-antigen ligase family protein [Planctomycetaceae bacterium]
MFSFIAKYVRWVGVILLGVTILIAPWCLGSIHASVQLWLFRGVMVSLICGLIVLLLDGKTRWSFPLLLLPMMLMLLLISQQLRLCDQATLVKRSPKVAELRERLLPSPDSEEYRFTREICPETQSSADPAPTSIYPAATRHQLSLFVLVVSAFLAAAALFRERIAVSLFGMFVVGNGCVLAMVGIVLRLNAHIGSLWIWDNNTGTFSTFLNRNNAAGYLGMCLGFAVFLLLWHFFRSDREIEDSHRWDKRFERAYMTTKQVLAYRFTRMFTAGVLTSALLAGILIAGILVSMSRGGSLAMGVALLIGFLVVFATRRFKLSMLGFALIGLMGLGLIFWAGMDERVQHRLETILTGDNSARPRNWSNAIETARDFQWRGSGFGTYQYANLLNDEFAKTNQIFVRAENQYIEIFLDLGIWGLLLLLASLVMAIAFCWRLIWMQRDDWLAAMGCGLLVVILTQAVASLFDFGLYIMSNTLLLAVCCGILSAVSRDSSRSSHQEKENCVDDAKQTWWNHGSRVGLVAASCFFLVLTHWGNKEIRNIHRIDLAMDRLADIRDYRSASPDELTAAIAQLDAAIRYRPDDATATGALADAQIGFYRHTVYHDLLEVSAAQLSEDEIWGRTSLVSTHASLGRLRRLGFKVPVQAIREHPAVDRYLRPAFANLVRSRQSNPMFVGTHSYIAELVPILDSNDSQREFERKAIERMTAVAPLSAQAWFEAGVFERNLGHPANARASWKQSLSLSRLYLVPIVQLTKEDMRGDNAKPLLQETFPNSPELFLTLVTRHFTQRLAPDFDKVALEVLKYSCETADGITESERHYYRGRYEMLIGQYDSAVKELDAACRSQRTNHLWRYHLALAYFSNHQYKDAEREIKGALFYEPGNKAYVKLRDDVQKAVMTR